MKKSILSVAAAAILATGTLQLLAEPTDFGVNGPSAWNQNWVLVRHKKTDAFGDTYYTYTKEYIKPGVQKELQKRKESFKQAPKEILEGLDETIQALNALQKNDTKKAQELLEKAVHNFQSALEADPNLKLVPIDQIIEVKEFDADVNTIKGLIRDATGLLKRYRTQQARDILLPMEDEIDIIVHSIPMELYPKVTQKALDLLKQGKKAEAAKVLAQGFSLIVTEEIVIPIPLLTSQALVKQASELYEKEPQKALNLLQKAKEELQKAIVLGYTTAHSKEYRALYDEILKIEKALNSHKNPKEMFKNLHKHYNELLQKHEQEKKRLKESDNVWQGTAKARQQATQEELNDKLRFLEEEKSGVF